MDKPYLLEMVKIERDNKEIEKLDKYFNVPISKEKYDNIYI